MSNYGAVIRTSQHIFLVVVVTVVVLIVVVVAAAPVVVTVEAVTLMVVGGATGAAGKGTFAKKDGLNNFVQVGKNDKCYCKRVQKWAAMILELGFVFLFVCLFG